MSDWLVLALLVPAVVAPVVLLFGFAGCHEVFGLDYVKKSGPNLTLEGTTSNSVTLSWTSDSAADRVDFERRKGTDAFAPAGSETGSASTHIDQMLDPSTRYDYRARFNYGGNNYSDYSAVLMATTAGPPPVRPAFDAVTPGPPDTGTGTATTSWMHTPTSSPVAVVVAVRWGHSGPGQGTATSSATYGGLPMDKSGVIGLNGTALNSPDGEYLEFFTLPIAPDGPRPVQITVSRTGLGPSTSIEGCAISYSQATAFDPAAPVTGGGSGTNLTQTVSAADNWIVVQMFGTSTTAIGNYNQRPRHQGTAKGFVVGDADGAASVTFTATRDDGADYAGLALRVTPP